MHCKYSNNINDSWKDWTETKDWNGEWNSNKNNGIDFKKFNLYELEQICSSIAMLIVDDELSNK